MLLEKKSANSLWVIFDPTLNFQKRVRLCFSPGHWHICWILDHPVLWNTTTTPQLPLTSHWLTGSVLHPPQPMPEEPVGDGSGDPLLLHSRLIFQFVQNIKLHFLAGVRQKQWFPQASRGSCTWESEVTPSSLFMTMVVLQPPASHGPIIPPQDPPSGN